MPKAKLKDLIAEKDREDMIAQLRQLPLLSAPLCFTEHLLTRLHGTHVKPNSRGPKGTQEPILAAIAAASGGGFEKVDLQLIQGQSDFTPYGNQVQFEDQTNAAFKPVTHGQFRLTKIHIVDKFGQAIHATDPTVTDTLLAKAACTSDYHAPQRLVRPRAEMPFDDLVHYQYIQIPPQINQFARLNASFVTLYKPVPPALGSPYWKPTSEWENPVWGWVLIDYANYGLQFFLADGTFYREVRVGGPTGAQKSAEWLPFAPDPNEVQQPSDATKQLQNLIGKLGDKDYLEAFVGMIDECMATLLPAPAAYAEHMSAAIGRPLALVNMGWSLELAAERYETQVLDRLVPQPRVLAKKDAAAKQVFSDRLYSFDVKLGSREKAYDALVGYFPARELPTTGDGLDLDRLYTYYAKTGDAPIQQIDSSNLPKFTPFYYDPTLDGQDGRKATDFYELRCRQQKVFGAIMDPFAAIHAYSSILPIKELRLPPWITQAAFAKMTPLFTIGPLLMPKDVPPVDAEKQVVVEQVAQPMAADQLKYGVPIPVPTLGTWNWLQPYYQVPQVIQGSTGPTDTTGETGATGATGATGTAGTSARLGTLYTRMKLDKVDQRTRFEPAPYTAIEGFLQQSMPAGTR